MRLVKGPYSGRSLSDPGSDGVFGAREVCRETQRIRHAPGSHFMEGSTAHSTS